MENYEIYFSLPRIGDLFLEHIFYMLEDEPILFVCKGVGGVRFLCSCCRLYEKWVVGQVSETELINLIDDKVTIRDTIDQCDTKFVVLWDGEKFELEPDVSENVLPKAGALLELEEEKTGAYREILAKYQKTWKSVQLAVKESQEMLSRWKEMKKGCAGFLKEWQTLAPALEMFSQVLSATMPTQILYQESEYWRKLYQRLNSFPVVDAKKDEAKEVQQQVVLVKHTNKVDAKTQNQTSDNDKIQYLAA